MLAFCFARKNPFLIIGIAPKELEEVKVGRLMVGMDVVPYCRPAQMRGNTLKLKRRSQIGLKMVDYRFT